MKRFTFKGGVHPYDGKELSAGEAIRELKAEAGDEMVFLLSQHIGATAKAIVQKGDRVLKGQIIAEAGGFVSAPVHSSVSGTVAAFERRRNALGDYVDAIIITNDGLNEEVEYEAVSSLSKMNAAEIVERVRNAGIVGMGGAGFPTAVKLSPKDPSSIDYVLINGCECEPYLTSDYRCMLEEPEKVRDGLKCMLRLFENAKGVICIEDNKPEAIAMMQRVVAEEPNMTVAVMKTKYPEGGERCLISAVTGRELNSKMLPADVGCVVQNVDTAIAVYEAVMLGKPLTERVFTVSGDAPVHPGNFRVPVGMSYTKIIEAAGGFKEQPEKVISGGPMMGFALYVLDIPVTKTSGALTAFLKDQVRKNEETACINCGRCLSGCPEHLMPCRLSDFAEHGDKEKFLALNGLECVECGSCSYQCPAKRPLAANIKAMKRTIMAEMRGRK